MQNRTRTRLLVSIGWVMPVFTIALVLGGSFAQATNEQPFHTSPPDETQVEDGHWYRASVAFDATIEVPFLLWLPDEAGEAIIRTGAQDQRFRFGAVLAKGMLINFGEPHHLKDGGSIRCGIIASPRPDGGFDGQWGLLQGDEMVYVRFRADRIPDPDATLLIDQPMSAKSAESPRWSGGVEDSDFTPQFEFMFEGEPATLHTRSLGEVRAFDGFAGPHLLTPVEAILEIGERSVRLSGVHTFFTRSGPPPSTSYELSTFDGENATLLLLSNGDMGIGDFHGDIYSVGTDRVSFIAKPTKERRERMEPEVPLNQPEIGPGIHDRP